MAERLSLILEALRERCRGQDNWPLSRFGRWRVTAKAVVCLLLARRRTVDYLEAIEVACFDWHGPYSSMEFMGQAWNWTTLVVPRGWRHWRWDTYWDGNA